MQIEILNRLFVCLSITLHLNRNYMSLERIPLLFISGAAGFIASETIRFFLQQQPFRVLAIDRFDSEQRYLNTRDLPQLEFLERDTLETYLLSCETPDLYIHFGARTDTTEMDYRIHEELNLNASRIVWNYCSRQHVPLIYASSAATYGLGEFGYEDTHEVVEKLVPLNPYGLSKNEFDKWVLQQVEQGNHPPHWFGLKFFNVYGPHESHKGRMASVIFHAFQQIQRTGSMKLFRSHHPDFKDGEQKRDFIYVKDLVKVTWWLWRNLPESGLYNLGTGEASTFLQLAHGVFDALQLTPKIEFIDTPIDIRDTYQYFTEANMNKLKRVGYLDQFTSLDAGIREYIQSYLLLNKASVEGKEGI